MLDPMESRKMRGSSGIPHQTRVHEEGTNEFMACNKHTKWVENLSGFLEEDSLLPSHDGYWVQVGAELKGMIHADTKKLQLFRLSDHVCIKPNWRDLPVWSVSGGCQGLGFRGLKLHTPHRSPLGKSIYPWLEISAVPGNTIWRQKKRENSDAIGICRWGDAVRQDVGQVVRQFAKWNGLGLVCSIVLRQPWWEGEKNLSHLLQLAAGSRRGSYLTTDAVGLGCHIQ